MLAESTTRLMLRVRDTMDRHYAEPLDLRSLAQVAHLSPSHVVRRFKAVFGETPHQYLYRRRIERAQWLLRSSDRSVARIAIEVGYSSVGTFTRTFSRLVGETPLRHRARGPVAPAPSCVIRAWTRPVEESDFGEDGSATNA